MPCRRQHCSVVETLRAFSTGTRKIVWLGGSIRIRHGFGALELIVIFLVDNDSHTVFGSILP
jgi:hypothetical protein